MVTAELSDLMQQKTIVVKLQAFSIVICPPCSSLNIFFHILSSRHCFFPPLPPHHPPPPSVFFLCKPPFLLFFRPLLPLDPPTFFFFPCPLLPCPPPPQTPLSPSQDQRSTVLSLQKLIVREVANKERGLFLITAGTDKPEMMEVLASSKEERNTWMQLIQGSMQSM